MNYLKTKGMSLRHWISSPIIFSMIIPLAAADLLFEIYHRVCFYLYKLPYVKRSDYIVFDRHKLSYLNRQQKIYCLYCSYANGVIHYWSEIAGQTEKYWCGIKHKQKENFKPTRHQADFADYGNEEDYRKKYL